MHMFHSTNTAMDNIEELRQPLLPPVQVHPSNDIPIPSTSGGITISAVDELFSYTGTTPSSTSPNLATSVESLFDQPEEAELLFLNLNEHTTFGKVQVRKGGITQMRVAKGIIQMVCKSRAQIMGIKVFVSRTLKAAEREKDYNGKMELKVISGIMEVLDDSGLYQQFFSVDLDSIFYGPMRPAYQLAKREVKIQNMFELTVQVQFIGRAGFQQFTSIPFQIKTKEKTVTLPAKKRKSDDGSVTSEEHEDGNTSSPSSDRDTENIECQNLRVIDHLEAQRATIDHVTFKVMESPGNADIGYRFKLKNPTDLQVFDEGDIVGFFKDKNGDTVIDLLNIENSCKAFMAGVISRSAYIEVKQSYDKDISDIVCVIGVVNLKCMGSVRAGERIYSHLDANMPGTAISEGHLPPGAVLNKRGTLLGMALEEKSPKKCEEPCLVKSFVCMVLGITDKHLNMEIENMYDRFEMLVNDRLKKERKRFRRVLCVTMSVLVLLLFGLSVLAFELFYPGSALRVFICKQGSMEGHYSTFKFTNMAGIKTYRVTGIEFSSYKSLQHKLRPKINSVPPLNVTMFNITKVHYYLNLDRCSYGKIALNSALAIDPSKEVGGPLIFGIDSNCSKVYYFTDVYYKKGCIGNWCPYRSVIMFPKDFHCYPKNEFT